MGIIPLLLFISPRLPTDSEPDEAHRQHAYQSYGSIHTGKLSKGVLRSPDHLSNSPSKRASRGSNGRLCLRRGAGVFRANQISDKQSPVVCVFAGCSDSVEARSLSEFSFPFSL